MSQPDLRYAPAPRQQGEIIHATRADSLADVLERVLDKGMVIAGDISIRLMDIELLTIHLRLLVASVEKAKEMGLDWWEHSPFLHRPAVEGRTQRQLEVKEHEIRALKERVAQLENPLPRDGHQPKAERKRRKKRRSPSASVQTS